MKTTLLLIIPIAITLASGCARKAQTNPQPQAKTDIFPHTLVELNMWYADTSSPDASPTYEKAFSLIGPSLNASASESSAAASQCVRANPAALKLLLDGAHFDSCRYSLDLTKGFEAVFPHLPKIKACEALLNAAALAHCDAR